MKACILSIFLIILAAGCSEDPVVENFKFQITPVEPSIIFSERPLTFSVGSEIIEVKITGPWMLAGVNVVNDNDRTITITAAEFRVTASDGEVRTAKLFQGIDTAGANNFGVFKAEGDINCDGFVTAADETAIKEPDCLLDDANPSYIGRQIYIYDLLAGKTGNALDPFRGTSFTFEVRLEGWLGAPTNPEKGFFKIVNFTVNSNSL